jgi:hypothetical protein
MRDWRIRRGGSKIYPALRLGARAYRTALRLWIVLDGARLTHRVSAKRKGDWPLGDLLLPDFPALSTAAVSVGPPSPGQKITVQLMDKRGRILGFAKYADRPLTRARLANEARMLETIPENVGPRLIRFTPFLEGDLLVQTPLPGRPYRPRLRLDAAQMGFLERLVQPETVSAAPEHPFIKRLSTQAGEHRSTLEAVAANLEDSEWPTVWMHGDLAPWNMHRQRRDCLAFDWELGTEAGFPYVDAGYMLVLVASVVHRTDPHRARRAISDRLRAWLPARYNAFAPAIGALSALYTLVSWYPPEHPQSGQTAHEHWLRTFLQAAPKI